MVVLPVMLQLACKRAFFINECISKLAREGAFEQPLSPQSPPPPPPRRPPPLPPLPPLPPGWKATKDPLGQMYYYNRSTGAVQYELTGSRQNRRRRHRRRRTATPGRRKEGRQETMIRLRAVAQFSTGDKKAELMGELAVLKNRERKRARRS